MDFIKHTTYQITSTTLSPDYCNIPIYICEIVLQKPLRKKKSPNSVKPDLHRPHFNNQMHHGFTLISALKLPTHFLRFILLLSTVARYVLVQKIINSAGDKV